MSQYQNYYPNQPFQQPINPMMNPQQRLQQMEQQYPQFANQNMQPTQMPGALQNQMLAGKIVNDFSEITANDVPMNGQEDGHTNN